MKILIALDYNPTAQKVAETGFILGKSLGAEMYLLNVVAEHLFNPAPEYSPIMGYQGYVNVEPGRSERVDGLTNFAQQFLDHSIMHLGDETIKTIVKEGDAAETILLTAKELKADIIVMGSHSRKWLENIALGSVAEKVLNKTTIPLFIIPTAHKKY